MKTNLDRKIQTSERHLSIIRGIMFLLGCAIVAILMIENYHLKVRHSQDQARIAKQGLVIDSLTESAAFIVEHSEIPGR